MMKIRKSSHIYEQMGYDRRVLVKKSPTKTSNHYTAVAAFKKENVLTNPENFQVQCRHALPGAHYICYSHRVVSSLLGIVGQATESLRLCHAVIVQWPSQSYDSYLLCILVFVYSLQPDMPSCYVRR
jgi:hypothetical protein